MIYFNAEMIKNANIKQRTVSKDTDKTKARVDEVWKSAKNADKLIAEELTGMKRSAIYRVFKKGSVNGKIILAISQVMNVDPFYLTGEIDDKSECTEDALLKFATDYGYDTLVKEHKSMKLKKQKETVLIKDIETEKISADPTPSNDSELDNGVLHQEPQNESDAQQDAMCYYKPEPIIQEQESEQPLIEISSETQELIDNVTEEDLIMLMKTVLFKAKFSNDNAKKADELRKLLVL